MESYQELINDKYMFGTPKENWERLEKLSQDSVDAFVFKNREATLLKGLEGTPDDMPYKHIKNLITASLRPLNQVPLQSISNLQSEEGQG